MKKRKMKNPIMYLSLLLACLSWSACSEMENEAPVQVTQSSAPETVLTDSDRISIKTAEIQLQVRDVPQSIAFWQEAVKKLGGSTTHYEVHANKSGGEVVSCSLDSNVQWYTLYPSALLKLKIPVACTDSFIHLLMKDGYTIDDFVYDEEDVTEKVKEEQLRAGVQVSGYAKARSLVQQSWLEEHTLEQIHRKAEYEKLVHRTSYLWFNLHLHGEPRTQAIYSAIPPSARTPWGVALIQSLTDGWYLLSGILNGLIRIWPLWPLLIFTGMLLRRKKSRLGWKGA